MSPTKAMTAYFGHFRLASVATGIMAILGRCDMPIVPCASWRMGRLRHRGIKRRTNAAIAYASTRATCLGRQIKRTKVTGGGTGRMSAPRAAGLIYQMIRLQKYAA